MVSTVGVEKLKVLLRICGAAIVGKLVLYLRWRRKINRSIPGPPDNLLLGASSELYKAGLNDFWGFNPRLFKSLFQRYGKMVRFWLPGTGLFVCCADLDDIAELNKKCHARPDLTETLLPFLGKDNLLFQKGAMIKNLRLRYGSMVHSSATLKQVHDVTIRILDERTESWGEAKSIDLHAELSPLIYDVMGEALFGGIWTASAKGQALRREHLYLIEWSSRYGMKVLKEPSWSNLWNSGSDLRAYFASIKKLRALCGEMIEQQRKAVQSDPKAFENDQNALTMLVTNQVSETDSKPFFSPHLSISTMIGFLNGAFDTTLSTSFWIYYHLARYPTEQARLAAEIDKLFGSEVPTIAECRNIELLGAFIKESMRLRPTVPLGMRVPETDVTIAGIHIPKGTTMLPFLDFQHDMEKHFGSEPDKFRPDRFMGNSQEARTARTKFDRFGAHARMCVGMTFAIVELHALVVRTLQKYTIELADPNMLEPDMIYEAGVYQPAEHFKFVFKKR